MELKDIKAIIDLMRKNDLSVFEMEKDGFRLKLQKGDTLFLTETKEGYLLTPYDPEFAAQMQQAEDVISRYRNTLKELAK